VTLQDGWERRRNILLSEYERTALEQFAARGYHDLTVDDIADAAGVTTRTLFRYFPSKQDFLLGFPRRGLAAEVEMIESLEPSDDPLSTAWEGIREFVTGSPVEPEVLDLWTAATRGAPEVVARVRGERIDAIFQAFVAYCERSLEVEPDGDPRARLLAGVLAGIEVALVESVAQVPDSMEQLVDATDDVVRRLARAPLRR
jgi:AcrR family transcriptional regulator